MKHTLALLSLPFLTTACLTDPGTANDGDVFADQSVDERDLPTWEEYVEAARRSYEGNTFYVVEGDLPVSEKELRERYEMLQAGITSLHVSEAYDLGDQKSIVNQHNGSDDVWTAAEAKNLTYCVSTNFGSNYLRAIAEMEIAANEWEKHADVDFIYVPGHDGNCSNANNAVSFAVRSWNSGGGCAFFPSGEGCVDRTLVMNYTDFDTNPSYSDFSTIGVYKHELGHILGLRHEHIRYSPCQWESTDYRALSPYDSDSVMYYPWCSGSTNEGDLVITDLDSLGVDEIYPRFGSCGDSIHFIDGPYASSTNSAPFVKSGTYLDYPVYTQGTWSIYRRANGKWYLDFNAVDESWSGTVAYTLSASHEPFSATWNNGAASQTDTFELSGGPYSGQTNGTFTLDSAYNGAPVYTRGGWSLYRRGNGEWHLDFNDVDEAWSGTVAYTDDGARTPWRATWNNSSIGIAPACAL